MQFINPESLGKPLGYSNGVRVTGGALLFVAGQIAWDRAHRIVSDCFATQFGQALANVLAVVRAAGGGPTSLTKLTIFVTSTDDYEAELHEVGGEYRRLMGTHFPAMSLVEVKALLEPGAKIEIEAMAVIESDALTPESVEA